jgi:hypothetical protein
MAIFFSNMLARLNAVMAFSVADERAVRGIDVLQQVIDLLPQVGTGYSGTKNHYPP